MKTSESKRVNIRVSCHGHNHMRTIVIRGKEYLGGTHRKIEVSRRSWNRAHACQESSHLYAIGDRTYGAAPSFLVVV